MEKIIITDQNKLFFTSDTHFFHANIIKYANRPFGSVEEMNEELIRRWNETVPEDGVVYHLGDFSFGWSKEWLSILPRLNGKIHLVLGNHDMEHVGESYMELFASVQEQVTLNVNGQMVVLNHNPFLCFSGSNRNTWQLFGHVHSGPNSLGYGKDESRLLHLFPTQYDVGVDNNDYRPISFAQVRAKIQEQIEKSSNKSKECIL